MFYVESRSLSTFCVEQTVHNSTNPTGLAPGLIPLLLLLLLLLPCSHCSYCSNNLHTA